MNSVYRAETSKLGQKDVKCLDLVSRKLIIFENEWNNSFTQQK
jgi:hypothetical protein